jgi:hypothetical protein
VGNTGLEPVTFPMSTGYSKPTELIALRKYYCLSICKRENSLYEEIMRRCGRNLGKIKGGIKKGKEKDNTSNK